MENIKNTKQFINLIHRYESITLEEIEEVYNNDPSCALANVLTGFGSTFSCTLCQICKDSDYQINCKESCVYGHYYNKKYACINDDTYHDINLSVIPEDLLESYRNRAVFMRNILNELKIDINEYHKS